MKPYKADGIDPERKLKSEIHVTKDLLRKWGACKRETLKFGRCFPTGFIVDKRSPSTTLLIRLLAKYFDVEWFIQKAHFTGFFTSCAFLNQRFFASGHAVAFFTMSSEGFSVRVSGKIVHFNFDEMLQPTVEIEDQPYCAWINGTIPYSEEEYEDRGDEQ